MKGAGLLPFVRLFPEQGLAETRVFMVRRHPTLPDDDYGLMESFCADATCHCRRVMLNVAGRRRGVFLATVSYGFDPDDPLAGPFLDPLNPQSDYSETLLELVEQALDDLAYVARLEAHYYQVKGAVADPAHPAHRLAAETVGKPASPLPSSFGARATGTGPGGKRPGGTGPAGKERKPKRR